MKHILSKNTIMLCILFIILVLFLLANMNSFEIQNFKDMSNITDINNISNKNNKNLASQNLSLQSEIQKVQDYNFLSKNVYNINPFNYNYLTNAIPVQNTWGWGTFNTNKMYPNSYSINKNDQDDTYRGINTFGVGQKCV